MFKRKLFKRALPIILSVAMVFQSAPTTAFAAEGTTEPETAIEQSTDEIIDDDANDNGAGGDESDANDNGAGGDEADAGQNESGNEESKSPETQTTTEESKTAETQTAEENKDAGEAQTETEEAVEEAVDNTEATASKAVISVNENTLVNNLSGYTYDYTTKTVEKSFKADSTETAEKVLDATKAAVKVTVDEQDSSTAKAHVTYKWQQKNAEGNFEPMSGGELPQAAGEYKLVISLGAVDGVCAAADDVSVSLTIKKAEITLDNTVKQFNPGVTVAEVKEKNADFTLKENNTTLTKDAYISASTIEVKDAAGTVLSDTAVLEKDKDYTLNINMTLKDEFAKNYEVKSEPVNIVFGNAVRTAIKVTYKKEGEAIGKTYDGKAIDTAAEVESKYDAKVVYTKDDKETELADAKLTAAWCNADGVAYEDAKFVPVDAGTYYYKLSYTDETGTYADQKVYIRVVIDMADVVIDPVIDNKEYSEGTKASAILKSVKYDVYEVKDGVKAEKPMNIDKNYFWGTSYNTNSDDEQYYAPVFAVQKGVKASDGKVTWGAMLGDNDQLVSGENVVYRVVFTGKKAIYDNGGNGNKIDINQSQQNYKVDVTADAIDTYAEDITLTAAVEVDVTPILEDGKGAEYENALIRTYNGQPKYKTRGEYKKATAKAGDKTLDSANLVYTWEMANPGRYTKDENGKWIVGEWIEKASFNNNVEDYSNPIDAGEYRLKVEYKDTKNGLSSKEPKYVYYTILPQNAKGVLAGTPKAYADDISVGDFIRNIQNEDDTAVNTYVKAAIVKVNEDGTAGDDISSEFNLDNCYENPATYFDVVRKIDEGENAGKWVSVDDGETFILGKEYEVRFGGNELVGNYNFGNKLDNHGQIVTDADPLYENTGVKVEVLNSSLIELDIDIDESQITDNVKVYDAQPFDLTALKSLVKVTNRKDGSAVTDAEVKYELLFNPTFDTIYGHLTGAEETWTVEDAIHGGIYSLHIFVETNEKYRYSDKVLNTTFEIKKAKLTVTPKVKDEIKAGINVGYVYVGDGTGILAGEPEITGYIGDDADLLTNLSAYVYAENSATILYNRLRSGKTYYVEYTAGFKTNDGEGNKLYGSRDYEFVSERTAFVPVRAEASVEANNTALLDEISGTPDKGYTHTITTREGIPYDQGRTVTVNGKSDTVEGNLFIFDLYAPDEFRSSNRTFKNSTFVYRNNIEKAGGYVLNVNNYDITVAFKADPAKLTEKKTFEILWDTDYSEKFEIDFSQSILKDDMTKAVAPKSLAFNGVNNKMAVGDTQQLDVKITKNQMRDIILLNYESSDESVLKVTDKGYVTALKKGKATVKVYPCYADKNGKKIAIKGAKAATVSITVSDVVAPKISKVTANGTSVTVTYQKPANGYRREIYVLEGKKKAADFETAIAKVINGDYSAFVVADLTASETPDEKGNVALTERELSPKSEYTVYVRNVSGLRALEDGSQVASSYAGAVKTFKTTKANTTKLDGYFKQGNGQTAIEGDSYEYVAKLKDKSAQLSVDARFYEKYSQKYSDSQDYIWRTLPLSGSDKDNYEEPKLAYCVLDPYTLSSTTKVDGWYSYNGKWYKPSSIASVDKKGKVTFKGEGLVKIYVYDTITGISDSVELYIETAPDSVKGKNIKMSVGQGILLSNYLEYKEGKNKVENYQDYVDLSIDKESDKNFDIVRLGGDYWIKALNPGAKLTLKVTDSVVKANKGNDTTVTITTTAINPVKGLKVQSVDDQKFTVTYSYPLNGYDFRFDLKDASGKVIDSVIYTRGGTLNTKTKTYDYTETFNNPEITRLSTYSLTVTALFNGQESKPAKLTVKTTDIPASYRDLGKEGNESNSTPIIVTTKSTGQIKLSDYPVLKSGNTYTLDVPLTGSSLDNRAARDRKTDTLTWKSTNPKVATVKANAGSYTATLKALNKGETIIEVTSKITKKVIARYTVTINAVGEAGGYYGDNEPYKGSDTGISDVVIDEKDMLELTMNNSISYALNKGEAQWYVFTAPAYGDYTFRSSVSVYMYSKEGVPPTRGTSISATLQKGTKRYLKISGSARGSVSVTGTMYTELTLGENKVKGDKPVMFKAPTANHYTITYVDNGTTVTLYSGDLDRDWGTNALYLPDSSKDYVVTVSCREADKAAVGGDGAAVSLGEGAEKWFSFTADETGIYTFYTTGASDAITGTIKKDMKDISGVVTSAVETLAAVETAADTPKDYKSNEIKLEKGQTVYIELTAAGATKDKAVTATFKVDKAPSVGADGKAGAKTEANVAKTITYVIPSQGDYRFTFTATPADAKITTGSVTVGDTLKAINNNVFEGTFAKNAFVKISVTTDKAADVSVAVEKTTKKVLSIGENKVNLAANATETVAFYATNSGYYTFKFAPTTVKADETVYLVAGQSKEFKLTSATAQEVTVTVSKADVATLTAGDVTVGTSGTKYFKYTATKEGLYSFGITKDENVSVTESDSLAFTTTTYKYIDKGAIYMTAGETFYVKISSTEAAAATAKATVTIDALQVTALTAGTETPIEIEAGKSAWVEFTAKKDARYAYTKQDATGFAIEKYNSLGGEKDNNYRKNFSDSVGEVIKAGTKQYFKVTNNNTAKQTIKLTISEIVPVAAGQSAQLKNGEGKWFEFTANAAARYTFSGKAEKDGKTPSAAITASANKITGTLDDLALSSGVFKQGEKYYFYIKATCDEADTVAVSLKTVKAGQDGELTAADGIEFKADALTKTLTWTAPETGWYRFSAKVGNEEIYRDKLTFDFYRNLSDTKENADWTELCESGTVISCDAGDKFTFVVTSKEPQTVKFAMSKETVIPVTSTETEVKMNAGDQKLFSFKEKEAARYYIELTNISDGLVLLGDDFTSGGSAETLASNGYITFVGSVDGEYVFAIRTESKFEGEKSFKIKGGVVAPIALAAGTPATIAKGSLTPNHYAWYKFTAQEDGKYAFKLTNAEAYYIANESLTSDLESAGPTEELTLKKDSDVYFAVYNDGTSDANKDVVLSVNKVSAATLTEAAPVKIAVADFVAGEKRYISFTAPADGRYIFTNNAGITGSTNIYESLDDEDSTADVITWEAEKGLKKGDEVLFAVSAATVPSADIEIKVSHVATKAITTSTEPNYVEFKADESRWMVFTADKTGKYTFEFATESTSNLTKVELYQNIADDNYTTYSFNAGNTCTCEYSLDKGTSVYFHLSEYVASIKVKASLAEEMTALKLGDNAFETTDKVKYAYFTATEAGVYKFTVSADKVIQFSRNIDDIAIGIGNSGNDNVSYILEAGDSIYFKETVSNKGTIKVEQSGTIEVLKENAAKTLSVTTTDYKWISFTAKEASYYSFDLSKGTACYLYSVSNGWLGYDYGNGYYDEYYDYYNSSFMRELDKDATIYLALKSTSHSVTTATICAKPIDLYFMNGEDEVGPIDISKGEVKYIEFDSQGLHEYDFTVSATSNVSVAYATGSVVGSYVSAGTSTKTEFKLTNIDSPAYIRLIGIEDNTEVTVSAESKVKTYPIVPGKNNVSQSIAPQETRVYKFTASKWARYRFEFSNSYGNNVTIAAKDAWGNKYSTTTTSTNPSIGIYLDEGDTGYVYVTNNSETYSLSGGVTVYTTQTNCFFDEYEVSVDSYGEYVFDESGFEPGGWYTFYSTGSADSWASLYIDGVQVDYSDDDGDGRNFKIVRYINAGQSVRLQTRGYGWNAASYTVHVTRSDTGSNFPGNLDE